MKLFGWALWGVLTIFSQIVSGEISGEQAFSLMEKGEVSAALTAFEALAGKGDTKAMVQLGIYYYEGQGVKQDYEKAMDWWLMGLSNQNADAFTNLGVMHRDGKGGVPKNKKIAYCVFLTTHMCSLGSQSTQIRANSCLRGIIAELSREELKDVLSNYTLGYMEAYLQARGKMEGFPEEYKPSEDNPALKDLDWWFEGELDGIFGEPSEEEKKARKEKAEKMHAEHDAVTHTLVFQIKVPESAVEEYRNYNVITDNGISSGPLKTNNMTKTDGVVVYEDDSLIFVDQRRYIAVKNKDSVCFVFEIKHPAKASPCDWSNWQKPDFRLLDSMDMFSLCYGQGKPESRTNKIPDDALLLRFKVDKRND